MKNTLVFVKQEMMIIIDENYYRPLTINCGQVYSPKIWALMILDFKHSRLISYAIL